MSGKHHLHAIMEHVDGRGHGRQHVGSCCLPRETERGPRDWVG